MQQRPKNIEAVFFDAGNTLIYPDYLFIQKLLTEYGLDLSIERLQELDREAKAVAQNTATNKPWKHYFTTWLTRAGVREQDLPELFDRLWQRHRQENLWSLIDRDAFPTLIELKKREMPLGVISNSDGNLEEVLRHLGLSKYLDVIVDSAAVGMRKPDPRIFEFAVREAKVKPDTTLFIGDSYEIDVKGAQNAGLQAVLFDPSNQATYEDCCIINRLKEVPGLFADRAAEATGIIPIRKQDT